MQARHDAKIRRAEKFEHLVGLVMADEELDRLVSVAAMSLVDVARQGFRLFLELAVVGELAARRRGHLDEGEIAVPFRMLA